MEYLEDLLITADLQIKTTINDYIYLSLDITDNISYFKTSYFIPEIFMKDEISMKNIGMKWNETSFVKIPKDIHILGKVWVTVNIPYFQIIEKLSTTTQITVNNATINQMIFDNHMTYLIMYENSPGNNAYYLIPDLFLKQPELNYNQFQFKFNQVKEYFIDLTGINIDDDTNIIFYSFNMNDYYSHDIIPLLLNLCDNYDKVTLQKLLSNYDGYKQNLLTQNSFDNYITKIIEDDLINEYQNINKFDTTIDSSYYNFMGVEFGVLYNNQVVNNSDISLVQNYITSNNINTVDSIDTISQNAIIKTPLVYEYLITNLNPSFDQTYTFYKKITTISTDSIYEYELTDANLVSGTITSDYPTFIIDITTIILPFTLTTDMIITTIDGISVVYTIVGITHTLTVDDSSPTILDNIKLVINTNNNTLNDPNINVKYPDVNSNSEWTKNLLINLDKLDYNKQLEVLLFYEFKKNYYSKESIISNDVLLFNSSVNSIKNFWIALKVVQDRFDKQNSLIGYIDDDYLDAIDTLTTNYPYIVGIENYPQDVFNVYSVVVNKLINTLKKKYFTEFSFLKFFYNKINSYIYQRNKNIKLTPTLPDYTGLLFYFNVNLTYYIDRNIIKNYLLELFYMDSYIAYIPSTGNSLTLSRQDINYYLDSANNNFNINNYFHELKYVNRYQLLEINYTLLNVGNKIAIKKEYMNYLFYKTNLVEFQLEISSLNAFLNVTEYSIDDTYVYLTYDTSNYNNTDITNNINYLYVNETIKMSVPMMYEPTTLPYTTAIVTVYDKISLFNAFISYNQVNVNIVSGTTIIMKYTKNNIISTYKCSISGTTLVNPDLPTNYNDYDLIQMISILLPTKNITISDSDCNNKIANTFPTIELLTSSAIYIANSALLVGANTFKITINSIDYPVNIISLSGGILYLYVYYNDSFSSTGFTTSINLSIFTNTKLPNLYNYTSLNNTTCETNDYMIQKPILLPFVDLSTGNLEIEPNTNFFILTNVPRMKVFNNYSSKAYLDSEIVLNVYSLYSNQLLRNGNNLYSTYYDSNLLANNNNIDDIETIVTHVYNGMYEDIYGNVVSVIENAQSQYINSYTEILSYISSGSKFGITLQNIEKYAELLNDYTLASNLSTIKLSLYDATLVDFDNNTLLATGLWNFTNRSNNLIKPDYDILSVLANKYNNSTMKIVNSLWTYYVPYVKINPLVIKYLDRYSSYATNMNNNLISNKSALILVNNKNFPQEFNEEYQMRDKYYHLATDTNKFIINSSTININDLDPTNKSIYISKATIDNKTILSDGTSLYTTENIEPYKFKPYYKETKYDNMNIYYKLVGAVRFESNSIINTLTLPDYIIADNLTIIKTFNYENIKTFDENFHGINYNSRELVLGSFTTITSTNINTLPFSFYLYTFSFTGIDPFVIGTKYLVSIDEQTGYLIKDGSNIITLLIGKKLVLNLGTNIKYASTVLTNAQIFSYVYNNTSFSITNNYLFTEFVLMSIGNYNKYFNSGLGVSSIDNIMFDSTDNLLLQIYGFTLITILDKFFINVSTSTNIKFYAVTSSSNYLPPIKITKSSISYFSTYEEIIKNVDNKDYWLFLKNSSNSYEFQIKDLETQTISTGSYLVYFCNNTDKPIVYSHPDTFRFGNPNFNRSFNYNPFTNKLTALGYNGVENPNYNYINTFSYIYGVTITVNALTQYKLPQNPLSPLGAQDTYLYPQRTYFRTNIRYNNGTTAYNRPIMITNELPDYDYQYFYTNYQVPGGITFIGDSLIYLTKTQYQALSTNTIVTNIKSISTPTSWITTTLTSLNNFITVDKITDGGGDKIFQFKIIPFQLIPFDTYNLIKFTTGTKDIYLWLYVDSVPSGTPTLDPHKFIDTTANIPMAQPLYYVTYAANQWNLEKPPAGSAVYATFEYTDELYFDNNTSYIEIANYSFNVMVRSIDDTYTAFYEAQATFYGGNAYDPTAQNYNISRMNEWSYINNTTINNQFIDDLTLQKFNLFIFKSSSDNYYFNVKKNNTNTGIELESDLEIGDYDVYIYNYEPIYISLPISYNVDGNTAYIYITRTKMQRNEVIRIGYYYVQIVKWSEYYNCYTGNILFSSDYIPVSNGYYSLGIFTNYLTRNTFLKGTNYNYHEYVFASSVDNSRIEVGDYYFENNELKQYTNDLYISPNGGPPTAPAHIFKLPYGNFVSLLSLAYLGSPQTNYYDGFLFDIKPGYTISYTDLNVSIATMGYARYPVMINNVDNNTITFNPTLNGAFSFGQNILYLPYQPFDIQTISIVNNVITGMTFNGWIQVSRPVDYSIDPPIRPGRYTPYYVPIVKVVNGVIINAHIYTGTFLAKIIDRDVIYGNIKHDFNNPQLNIYDNTNCAVKIYLYASTSDTNVYFYYTTTSAFNDAIDNNTLQFCYYQSIIVNGIWYNIIKIDKPNHRIYIDIESISNLFTNNELYEVIISAANVNNINLVSNNHKLRTSHAIDYPFINYTYDTPGRLTSLFKGSNNNKYIFNFKDASIGPCTNPYNFTSKGINSPGLLNTINYINNNNYQLERYDYYENFVPLIMNLYTIWYGGLGENYLGYNFYQVPLDATETASTLMINVNGVQAAVFPYQIEYNYDPYPKYSYLGSGLPVPRIQIVKNILLQEITTDGTIYQHYITISKTNYHIKITNTCFFQNIETSSFYLNNVIPCIVTKYNNIILMPPDYHFYRDINQTSRKIINLIYTVKLEQDGPPTFINNQWKYYCKHLLGPQYSSIDKEIFNKMDIFVNNKAATYEYDVNEYFYLYIDDYLEVLTEFTYNASTSVDSIVPDTTTIKSEYSSLTTDELEIMTDINNDYNLRFANVLNLSKTISSSLSFKDQTSPTPVNINFGDIDDTNYIGKSNKITYSAIQTNSPNLNSYTIDTLYPVLDVSSSPILYSILTNLSIVKPLYYVLEPEISTSVPALELLINDEGLSTISLLNESKSWDDWTLITTRLNAKLEPYLNNYDLIYNGASFTTLASTSYFTNNEIVKMKVFMELMYGNNDAQAILTELYLVEQYLLTQIINYATQRYFWDDIINILKKIVANYKNNFGGTYNWTITNNVLCIEDEFTLYPENFEFIGITKTYIRLNYLSIDYTIDYAYLTTKIKISRDPAIIDTNIAYVINNTDTAIASNLYGTNINNVINTLINYGTRINKINSSQPIYYKYMDSVKYYVAKLFFEIFNTNDYKFNNLTTFDRTTNFDSNYQYYGKYYDYYFNKRYYGINGFNQYYELNNDVDTNYVEGNIINTLYSSEFNQTSINKLTTNNIFKYIINIKNEGYEKTDLIKASNIYTIDIKDNYNHLVDPTIDNVYINTNSLEFSTTEMVQPTDISILSSEPYTFSKFDYGLVMVATTNSSTLNTNYTITSNNIPVLFIEQNSSYNYDISYNTTVYKSEILSYVNGSPDSTINLRTSTIRYNYIIINNTMYGAIYNQTTGAEDNYTISNYILPFEIGVYYDFISFQSASKATNKVVIKTSTYNSLLNRTYITFSANYTSDFVYITINNIVYPIVNSGGYYINGNISITTNIIYEVFKTFNISLVSTDYNYISDFSLDREINPIKYNQVDINLPMTFNIDNTTINKVEILTSNKVRLTYNIIDITKSIGTTLYHKYRLNESIPYLLSTITPISKYYYTVANTYKMTITDTIDFDIVGVNTYLYGISNNIITFYTDVYCIVDDLNNADMIIVKSYDIESEIVSYVGTTMVINIPANIVNANAVYSLDNGTSYAITSIVFSEYIIITTTAGISTTNLKLIQTITDTNHTITESYNNQEYTIVTSNISNYDNKSPYFLPIIQCLDTNLNEFDAKYYYNFSYVGPFTFGDFIFINYNDIFIKAIIIMIQDTIAVVGTNSYINCSAIPTTLTIYSADISEYQSINLLNQYYPYNMGTLLEQTNTTTYKILLPKDSMFEYNVIDNTTTNKMIMAFRYSEMNLNNITYPLVGFNKVPSITKPYNTNTTNYLDIDWIEYIGVKLFKSIELLIDDVIVEKINYNIYGIFGYYLLNEFKRAEFNNLTKIRQYTDNFNNKYYYYNLPIPILLENYLPISSMGRSTIKIKFTLEKLENLISNNTNNYAFTKNVIPSIDFNYTFMTVDNNVLNKFKKTELLLTTFYYYNNYLLNKVKEYNHISLLNRTLEIFFIAKTKNDENNYTSTSDKDNWYNEYLSNNPNDSYVFSIVDAEIAANSYRYNVLLNHLIIKNYSTRFAMYLDTKYLNHINENLNNPNLKFSNKLTILSLYFQNIYKNTTILTPVDIIDKLNIYINGKEILPELPSSYHNNVISYYKGLALPFGYYMYGFNYHALSTQPNGFINMKKIRDFLIYSSQPTINEEYKLKICTREYKILKIDNLMGQI
uniref:Uncharacterized protein n=1 Tax=viral metagenome TaxID=1070528 RepID=A0A6C0HWN3_9ZZZZ